jgi:hypothetical protein
MYGTILIIYKKHNLKYGITYFDEPYTDRGVDIVQEWQYSMGKKFSAEFYTLCINLNEDEETIFSRFEKNTKYKINRAKNRDKIITQTLDPQSEKIRFKDFYNAFAASKGLSPLGEKEIDLLIAHDMFVIRSASWNNETIVYHSYITSNGRARLAHSASFFRESLDSSYRNMIGRANRLLHWDDMVYFKILGLSLYDLGGISMDSANKETAAINQFKECFGGFVVKEYKSWVPVSVKGWCLAIFKKITGRL